MPADHPNIFFDTTRESKPQPLAGEFCPLRHRDCRKPPSARLELQTCENELKKMKSKHFHGPRRRCPSAITRRRRRRAAAGRTESLLSECVNNI